MMKVSKLALLVAAGLILPPGARAEYDSPLGQFNQAQRAALPEARDALSLAPLPGAAVQAAQSVDPTSLPDIAKKWQGDQEKFTKWQKQLSDLRKDTVKAQTNVATKDAIELNKLRKAREDKKKWAAKLNGLAMPVAAVEMPSARENACRANVNWERMNQMLALAGQPLSEFQGLVGKILKRGNKEELQKELTKLDEMLAHATQASSKPKGALDDQQKENLLKSDIGREIWFKQKLGEARAENQLAHESEAKALSGLAHNLVDNADVTDEVQALGRQFAARFNGDISQAYRTCRSAAEQLWQNCDSQAKGLGAKNPYSAEGAWGDALKAAKEKDAIGQQSNPAQYQPGKEENYFNGVEYYWQQKGLSCPSIASQCDALGPQLQAQFSNLASAPDVGALLNGVQNATQALQQGLSQFEQSVPAQVKKLGQHCDNAVAALHQARQYATSTRKDNTTYQQQVLGPAMQQRAAQQENDSQAQMMMMMMMPMTH